MALSTLDTRGTSEFISQMRRAIRAGRYPSERFLPSVRHLALEHALSPETVRRGLVRLSVEGLLEVRPRRGFLVLQTSADMAHLPVAYVTEYSRDLSDAQPVNWAIDKALTMAAGEQGRGTLGVHVANLDAAKLREQLGGAQAWGIVLDTLNKTLADVVRQASLPVVMINSWLEDSDFNVVLQDNYLGGFLAARHLVEAGAKRIAWINPVGKYCHSRERFAGAVAGLASYGRSFESQNILDTGDDTMNDSNAARILALLRSKDRPDAALIFWRDIARPARRLIAEAGLRIGRDLKIVGWSVDELFEREHCTFYEGVEIPPAITWKARSMTQAALHVLNELRANASGEPRRVLVPTRLRMS